MTYSSSVTGVFLVSLILFESTQCSRAQQEAPTKEIVEKVMKGTSDKEETSFSPKCRLAVDELKLGKAYKATAQEVQVEGFPEGGMVSPAIVTYTVRSYYNGETQALHRMREARVYKDKFGEWAVITGSVKGQDTTTKEPAANLHRLAELGQGQGLSL